MQLQTKTVRQGINKAFLKEPVERPEFDNFKNVLSGVLDQIDHAVEADEHEEHLKNLLPPFFKALGFDDHKINTSGRIDLAIYTGTKKNDPVGVLMEVKRPGNKAEMISRDNFNKKAMHEAVLYYLEQRIEEENTDLKHVIITNMHDWFIFDAQEFERCFYKPSVLRKIWKSWKADQKVSSNNDFMYDEIAKFVETQDTSITGLYVPLHKTRKLLGGQEGSDYEKKLIPLFKLFTPIHLLKESFANDSNSLNREFYRELLYILGLEETTEGNTRYIRRVSEEHRNPGSMIENTIRILDAEDHLSTLSEPVKNYGEDKDDQLFGVALELGITWMNRVLFLKLLEAQLFRYHRGDKKFKFLNSEELRGFDALNTLFFQVLARRTEERSDAINEKFGHIPYLNSSLFDVSDLEHDTTRISGLTDTTMPVYNRSVLNDLRGNELSTLDYLFRFLEAFDFSAEGKEEIRSERKSLINASVLGLIFEKINGYKDGSFYTPGFITEYMARETLRKAVVDKFIEAGGIENGEELTISDLYNHIGPNRSVSIKEANEIVNSITICDPAVGSGHFLVSCLNELLAIKSDLGILSDVDGKAFRDLNVMVENDELIVSFGDDELFEYDLLHTWQGQRLVSRKIASERQRIQQALFHEKSYLIENCLFGVDINLNSVKICRLRLWIELLKRAFYTPESKYLELEVLPNIDINIKQGNSLVSRFELDSDLSSVFKKSKHSLEDYKKAVRNYKHTGNRAEKKKLRKLIDDIKETFTVGLEQLHPERQKLKIKEAELIKLKTQFDMFGDEIEGEAGSRRARIKKAEQALEKQEYIVGDLESGTFYNQAFEWRFEFPEVLNEEGEYVGFDVVIGNPPYISVKDLDTTVKNFYKDKYFVAKGQFDLYLIFVERGSNLLKHEGYLTMITSNTFLSNKDCENFRRFIVGEIKIEELVNLDETIFQDAKLDVSILLLQNSKAKNYQFKIARDKEEFLAGDRKNFPLDSIKMSSSYEFKINLEEEDFEVFDKLHKDSAKLGEIANLGRGIEFGSNSEEIKFEKSKSSLPIIVGGDVGKYLIRSITGYAVHKEDDRSTYKRIEDFRGPRILIQRIRNLSLKERLVATYTEEKILCTNTLRIVTLENGTYDYKALLGILNSKLINYFFRKSFNNKDIYAYQLGEIPIKKSDKIYKSLSEKVDQILTAKKENPEAETSKLEAEIDRLVYKLYGLSEEEIGIVEGSV